MNECLELTVHRVWQDGEGVCLFDLRLANQAVLPSFTAGAHIDLYMPDDMVRQYSLCNHPNECHRYVIAVAKAEESKGGSLWLHEHLHEGDVINVSPPRNHFGLDDSATHSVLVAGGIGITPILTMATWLEAQGKTWELHFSARSQQHAPLLSQIVALQASMKFGRVHLYYSRETQVSRLDLALMVAKAPRNAHFYCCGPSRLLDAYSNELAHLPESRVHLERFHSDQTAATQGGFTVVLARSGKELEVQEGQTVLEVLKKNAINIRYACAEGVCGSCEVTVLEGQPDHRDMVLSDAEKSENTCMMVCCSGSLSDRLVLDL